MNHQGSHVQTQQQVLYTWRLLCCYIVHIASPDSGTGKGQQTPFLVECVQISHILTSTIWLHTSKSVYCCLQKNAVLFVRLLLTLLKENNQSISSNKVFFQTRVANWQIQAGSLSFHFSWLLSTNFFAYKKLKLYVFLESFTLLLVYNQPSC